MPKNDITRSRGEYPGEAGADWEHGANAKPEADEHHNVGGGLSGSDKSQAAMRDMVQRDEDMPEGLLRERKGPLDKNVGRNEEATQIPGYKR